MHSIDANTVVVCGCNFPNCPRTTIYEAGERDFRIVLAKDVTSFIYDIALQELKNVGVSIMNTDECITRFGASYSKVREIVNDSKHRKLVFLIDVYTYEWRQLQHDGMRFQEDK